MRAVSTLVRGDKSRAEVTRGWGERLGIDHLFDGNKKCHGAVEKHSRHELDNSGNTLSSNKWMRRTAVSVLTTVKMCFRTGLRAGEMSLLVKCVSQQA